LLENCPRLVSFTLEFDGHRSENGFLLSTFMEAIGYDLILPELRTFRILSSPTEDWDCFLDKSSSEVAPFRAFLTRHPALEDLAIVYNYESSEWDDLEMDPEDIAQLLPSLKRFEGPGFMFLALVSSTLAPQLETIILSDTEAHEGELSFGEIYNGAAPLPKLRQFTIQAGEMDTDIFFGILRGVVTSAPNLEKLAFPSLEPENMDFVSLARLKSIPSNRLTWCSHLHTGSTARSDTTGPFA
jgi:hypothetical protein